MTRFRRVDMDQWCSPMWYLIQLSTLSFVLHNDLSPEEAATNASSYKHVHVGLHDGTRDVFVLSLDDHEDADRQRILLPVWVGHRRDNSSASICVKAWEVWDVNLRSDVRLEKYMNESVRNSSVLRHQQEIVEVTFLVSQGLSNAGILQNSIP